jgi:two-component system, cell cycle response regulator DivK
MISRQPSENRPLIVVVEDHPLVAKFYNLALERTGGFRVEITEDAQRVCDLVDSGEASLLLLDVSLRETFWEGRLIDGIELSRMMKNRATRWLPILLATAHAMAGDREKILRESGADVCLEKPIYDTESLVKTIRELLDF